MIREHYQQFYGDKFNNLDKMNKCFEKCNLQKLTQGLAEKKNWLMDSTFQGCYRGNACVGWKTGLKR